VGSAPLEARSAAHWKIARLRPDLIPAKRTTAICEVAAMHSDGRRECMNGQARIARCGSAQLCPDRLTPVRFAIGRLPTQPDKNADPGINLRDF
jgi:hypothetical protein